MTSTIRKRCPGCRQCRDLPKNEGVSYRHPAPGAEPVDRPYRVRPKGHPERSFATKREAMAYYRRVADTKVRKVVDVDGRKRRKSTWTVADYARQQYIPSRLDWSPGTIRKRKGEVNRYVDARYRRLATMAIAEVERSDVDEFFAWLTMSERGGERLSWSTIEGVHGLLSKMFRHAFNNGVRSTPLVMPEMPKYAPDGRALATTADIVPPTDEDVAELFAHMERVGERLLPVFQVAAWTGMRIGEVLALRRNDVDLVGRRIRVDETLDEGVTHAPKSKRSNRVVHDVDPRAIAALSAWFVRSDAEQAGRPIDIQRFVFTNPDRDFGPVSDNIVGDRLRDAAAATTVAERRRAAGLAGLRFHDLRHYYVTKHIQDRIDSGRPVYRDLLAQMIGDTVAVMERVYIHQLSDHRLVDASAAFAATMP